jgi:outer membrane receptor for ferrienterochelin and colicins
MTLTMFCMVFVVFVPLMAQQPDASKSKQLEDVVITGQYAENSLSQSVYRVKVIGQKRIEQQGAVNLRDLLNNELNVRINNDPALGSGLSIQGINGQNIKIMIDGVPVVGREGNFIDLNQLNLNNIERIEVVEGPMSVSFGTDALGGVINLITKKSYKPHDQLGAKAYYENIGQYNLNLFTSIYLNREWRLEVNGSRNFFDGFAQNEDSRVKLWKPRTQYFGDLSISKKFTHSSLRITGSIFDEKVTNRDSGTITPYSAYGIDQYYYTRRISTAAFYEQKLFSNHSLHIVAAYNHYRRIVNTTRKDLVTLQENLVPEAHLQDTGYFKNVMSRGTFSRNKDKAKYNYQLGYETTYDQFTGNRISNGTQSLTDISGFASMELKFFQRLLLRPGMRLTYNSKYQAPIIPSLNLKWDIRSDLSLRASFGRGFRSPTLKELYLNFTDPAHNIKGNPDLKAETQNNYQLSLTHQHLLEENMLKVDVALFYNEIFNKIDLVLLNSNTLEACYTSISDFRNVGTNITAEYVAPDYAVSLGYALIGINNTFTNMIATDKYFTNHEYRCNARYLIKKIKMQVALFCKYNSLMQLFQYNITDGEVKTGFIDGFTLLDLTASRSFFNQKLTIQTGVKNMLDVLNVQASLAAGPHAPAGNNAAVSMGRTYFCAIQYQLSIDRE